MSDDEKQVRLAALIKETVRTLNDLTLEATKEGLRVKLARIDCSTVGYPNREHLVVEVFKPL